LYNTKKPGKYGAKSNKERKIMRSRVFIAIAIAILVITVSLASIACVKQGTKIDASALKTIKAGVLTVGSDTTWPPMEYIEGDKIVGFDVDLTQAIADKLGLKLDYQSTAWDGIIPALVAHKFDMVISSITITEEKKKEVDFSDPYFETDQAAITKADAGLDSADKMNGKNAGVQLGTTGEIAAKKITGLNVKTYDDILMALEDLKAGRIDAVFADSYLGYSWATKNAGYKVGFVVVTGEQLGIAIAKDTPELKTAVNSALKAIKDEGAYDTIFKKWFGTK
jgi:ABC-type amino acid transport substrate-binding protein